MREAGASLNRLDGDAAKANKRLFDTGAALTAVGVGVGAVGAAGVSFFNSSVNAFIDYNKQVALTQTQTRGLGVSIEDLAAIGTRVASKIPAPFSEMQDALFDIFSSMDIGVRDAERLLALFAQGAVAGQTDIRTAARTTIAVMNAYQLPFTDANKVMDTMFNMVRFGIGTYEEFNTALGRAIPAAVAASQEFDTLGAVMIFLTRAGLSTQMAATSAARAFELFTKPDVVESLRNIGVEVVNQQGNFKQMDEVLRDLAGSEGWAQLGAADRKKLFQDIFGVGTIQARRFFDTAIPNFESMIDFAGRTRGSAGALEAAYKTMFEAPASQVQLLTNQYEIMKTEIGEELLPAKLALMRAILRLFEAWNNLDKGTRSLIIRIAAITATVLTFIGVVLAIVGIVIMVKAVLIAAGITFAALAAVVGIVIVAIAALIAIGFLLYRNWGTVKEVASDVWATLQDFAGWLSSVFVSVWGVVVDVAGSVVDAFQVAYDWFQRTFGPGLAKVWEAMSGAWEEASTEVLETLDAFQGYWRAVWRVIDAPVKAAWDIIVSVSRIAWDILRTVVSKHVDLITTVVEAGLDLLGGSWGPFWNIFSRVAQEAWNIVATVVSSAITIIANHFGFFLNILQGDWGEAWDNVKRMVSAAWRGITAILKGFGAVLIATILAPFVPIIAAVVVIWKQISGTVSKAVGTVVDAVTSAWDTVFRVTNSVLRPIVGAVQTVWGIISDIFETVLGAVMGFLTAFLNWWKRWWGYIYLLIGGPVALITLLIIGNFTRMRDFIMAVVKAIWGVIKTTWESIWEVTRAIVELVVTRVVAGWNVIWAATQMMWDVVWNIIKAVWGLIYNYVLDRVEAVWAIIQTVWQLILQTTQVIFGAIAAVILAVWQGGILPVFNAVRDFISSQLVPRFVWLKDRASEIWTSIQGSVSVAWGTVVDTLRGVVNFVKNEFYNAFVWIRDKLAGIWTGIKNTAKTIWEGIITTIRAAVNSAIGVINKIIDGINAVKNFLHLPLASIPHIPAVSAPRSTTVAGVGGGGSSARLAAGGSVPPFVTNGVRAIVGEGRRAYPEYVIPTDPAYRGRAIALLMDVASRLMSGPAGPGARNGNNGVGASGRMFALGGIIPDWVPGAGVIDDAFALGRKNIAKAVFAPFNLAADALISAVPWPFSREMLRNLKNRVYDWVKGEDDYIEREVEKIQRDTAKGTSFRGGPGVERWRGTALQALGRAGTPSHWIGSLLRRMNQESGGNPYAINRWDSNWLRGTPSVGLMQVIGPTFRAYAGPYRNVGPFLHGTSVDPLANIYSSIKYTVSRYGSGPAGWDRKGGYAQGAWKITQDQLAMIHRGEMILPKTFAEIVRGERGSDSFTATRGATFNFYGDVTFGSDMPRATADLDFYSRVQRSGV